MRPPLHTQKVSNTGLGTSPSRSLSFLICKVVITLGKNNMRSNGDQMSRGLSINDGTQQTSEKWLLSLVLFLVFSSLGIEMTARSSTKERGFQVQCYGLGVCGTAPMCIQKQRNPS